MTISTQGASPKARPILFSTPMIRALLDGRKTQTRRIMKGYNPAYIERWQDHDGWSCECPYGRPGDLLWVRECFSYERLDVNRNGFMPPWYWADSNPSSGDFTKPKPSIHMPRWASRLTLELTGVRVERLQEISEADAIAESAFFTDYGRHCFHSKDDEDAPCRADDKHHPVKPGWMWKPTTSHEQCLGSARFAYANLWNTINGPASWDANPWVWVLSFRVHQRNVDDLMIRGVVAEPTAA